MAIDIYNLIFELLRVSPSGDFQKDFLELIFFPHVVIMIWLFLVAKGGLLKVFHKGISLLLVMSMYIFIIYYGWYSTIASLSMVWLGLTIVISFFYFIIPKFSHPGKSGALADVGGTVGKFVKRGGNLRELEHTIDELMRQKKMREDQLNDAMKNPEMNTYVINNLKTEIYQIQNKIKELQREHDKQRW